MNRTKALLVNALIVVASIVFSLLAGELVIRYVPLGLPTAIIKPVGLNEHLNADQPDPVVGNTLKAGLRDYIFVTGDYTKFSVDTNSPPGGTAGFRETFDVTQSYMVAVGDSFAFGWGQEYPITFVRIVQDKIGKRILDFGLGGQGPIQYNLVLENWGLTFKPKVVLWQFFPNDFMDCAKFKNRMKGANNKIDEAKSRLKLWFTKYSSTYKLYKYITRPYSSKVLHYNKGGVEYAFEYNWEREVDMQNPDVRMGYGLVLAELDKLKKLSEANGFVPVVLVIPEKEQLYYRELRALAGKGEGLDMFEMNDKVASYARSIGLRVFDGRTLLEKNMDKQIYFKLDGHFTDLGAKIFGEGVADFLKAEKLDEL